MKVSKADYLRSWGLPYPSFKWHHLRYKNPPEKGVLWYFFAKMVRERDMKQWGRCISCNKPMTEGGDAGHFIAASKCGIELLFDPLNVNLECGPCNAWDETHLLGYERGLDSRHGPGTATGLKQRFFAYKSGPIVKDWSKDAYIAKLGELGVYKIA